MIFIVWSGSVRLWVLFDSGSCCSVRFPARFGFGFCSGSVRANKIDKAVDWAIVMKVEVVQSTLRYLHKSLDACNHQEHANSRSLQHTLMFSCSHYSCRHMMFARCSDLAVLFISLIFDCCICDCPVCCSDATGETVPLMWHLSLSWYLLLHCLKSVA